LIARFSIFGFLFRSSFLVFLRSVRVLMRLSRLLPLLGLAACGGARPPVRAPEVGVEVPQVVDRLTPPWRIGEALGERAQRVAVSAVLTSRVDSSAAVASGAAVVRTDSVESVLDVRWGLGASGGVRNEIPVRVGRYVVRVAPDTTWRVPPGIGGAFVLSARAERGAVPVLCAAASVECTAAHVAAAQGWQESWVGGPAVLEPGMRWRDSTRSIVLRDSIPLAVTSVREFTVREAVLREGRVVLVVDRRSTNQLAGEGRQFGEAVRITGRGEGVMRLEVVLTNGAVLRGDGTSVLTLQLVGRRRTQSLTQESAITITAP
jgi:hypothetical protein